MCMKIPVVSALRHVRSHPIPPSPPLPQTASPFDLQQPFNLVALLQQEERVSRLRRLKDELIDYKNEFEGLGSPEGFDAKFRAEDPECKNVKPLSTFDLYISTALPLEHKGIQ